MVWWGIEADVFVVCCGVQKEVWCVEGVEVGGGCEGHELCIFWGESVGLFLVHEVQLLRMLYRLLVFLVHCSKNLRVPSMRVLLCSCALA